MTFSECCNNALQKRNHPELTFCVLPNGKKYYQDKYGNMFSIDEVEDRYPTPAILSYSNNCDTTNDWFFK